MLFFQDNGHILKYDIIKKHKYEYKLFDIGKNDNWKMTTRVIDNTTKSVILYEHSKAVMKIYDIWLNKIFLYIDIYLIIINPKNYHISIM